MHPRSTVEVDATGNRSRLATRILPFTAEAAEAEASAGHSSSAGLTVELAETPTDVARRKRGAAHTTSTRIIHLETEASRHVDPALFGGSLRGPSPTLSKSKQFGEDHLRDVKNHVDRMKIIPTFLQVYYSTYLVV